MSKGCLVRCGLLALTLALLLSSGRRASAQYTSGLPMDARGPYTNTYIAPWYVPPYDARITWPPPHARFAPIMLTSINYPGIYGSFSLGIEVGDYRGPIQFVDRVPGALVPRLEPVARPEPTERVAHVDVRLPANAELWFQGVRMSSTGESRHFVTPPLRTGQSYGYDVRASWVENGKTVTQDRHVRVTAGERLTVDFTQPATLERGTPPNEGPSFELRSIPRR
jgi:uncharacterized protein (TIGR03000 family)